MSWVDCCRVLAMFSVVYGHTLIICSPSQTKWTSYIMGPFWDASAPSTSVLMFFFFSGWLRRPKVTCLDFRTFLFLCIPVVVWNLIQLMIEREGVPNFPADLAYLGIVPGTEDLDRSLWFLDMLAWFSLFLPLVLKIPRLVRLLLVCVAFAVVYVYQFYIPQPWDSVPKVSMDISFFLLGTVLNGLSRNAISRWAKACSPYFLAISVFAFFSAFIPPLAVSQISYTPLFSLLGLCCILSYGAFAERFFPPLAHLLACLAPAVFFLYAAHWPFFYLWMDIEKCFMLPHFSGYAFILYTVVCSSICVALWWLASRYAPGWVLSTFFLVRKRKS
ncbi:MAG: acyltransferase [Akkermansia sp.]|nr:acyltransferase [Akkermansia sp.]